MLNKILQTEAEIFMSAITVINGAATHVGIASDGLDAGFLQDYADGSIRVRRSPIAVLLTLPFALLLGIATALACVLALACSWMAKQDETKAAAQTKGRISVTAMGYITLALIALQVALRHG